MYSESRVTRSKARSQGLKQFDELPLSSTKGRTTSKKPRERSAFYDVTNADQSLSGEDSTSSVKNLSADFTPVKAETDLLVQASPSANSGNAASGDAEPGDGIALDAMLPTGEGEPVPLLHKEQNAEAEEALVSTDADNESSAQSALEPVASSLQNEGVLNTTSSPDPRPETKSKLQEQISIMEPIAEEHDVDVKAATPVQQSYLDISAQGIKGDADSALHTSHTDEAPSQEDDAAQFSSADTPKQSLGCSVFASKDLSATPATVRQPELSDQPTPCDVPATVVAKQSDAGHLMPDSLTPQAAQTTPARATAAIASSPQASPTLTMPYTGTPAAVGLLDAAYFSESDPDRSNAAQESAKPPAVPNTAASDNSAAPTEAGPKETDMIEPVYFCESDSESAELTPEAAPSSLPSAIKDANGPSDLSSGLHSMQPSWAPEQPFSPGMGNAHKPASDSAGTPMTSSAAVTDDSAGMMYSISPKSHRNESLLDAHDSSAPEVESVLPTDKGHLAPTNTEGWCDRWQMEDDTAPALSNDYSASAAASRLSSQVYASPSYDPRSLKQLRKEVADKLARQAAAKAQAGADVPPPPPATPAGLHDSESDADMSPGPATHGQSEIKHIKDVDGDELCDALESLEIQSAGKSKEPLRGLPVPQGMHLRFDDDGQAVSSPSTTQTRLRGVPAPRNSHIRFD